MKNYGPRSGHFPERIFNNNFSSTLPAGNLLKADGESLKTTGLNADSSSMASRAGAAVVRAAALGLFAGDLGHNGVVDLVEQRADGVLRKYGYEAAESIYDEWNYVKDWSDIHPAYRVISSAKGMAMNAAVMAAMQSTPVTAMCYYDAQMKFASSWDGLFKAGALNGVHGEGNLCAPKKGYFAFKAFNEVYRLGAKDEQAEIGRRQNPGIADQVRLTAEGEGLYAVASRSADGTRGAVLAAGFSDPEAEARPQRIAFSFRQMPGRKLSVYLADETHDLEKIDERPCGDLELELPPFSVLLLLTEE